MCEYRKRKRLEGDISNNVRKRTKLNAERQRDHRKRKAEENKTPQVGISRAVNMREYRKRMRVENDICNNVPKRTKLNAERQRDYRSAKLRREFRKIKHHKHLRQLTRQHL
jgi:hypothetical protein